ncbi:MAG: PEGA domain-containing protein [Terriglobia bacterium]
MKIRQTVATLGLVAALAPGMAHAQAASLADGTRIHVRLKADLLSSEAVVGSRVDMEIAEPVTLQGVELIPEGTAAWGAVQAVKKGKILDFDIEEARLPNGRIVMLRCSPQRATQAKKDGIKVEIRVGSDLGAPKGIEFTAYLDQDLDADVALETPPAARPAAAGTAVAASALRMQKPEPVAQGVLKAAAPLTSKPDTPSARPLFSASVASAGAPGSRPVLTAQAGESVTIGCFTTPPGAEILIDGESHGTTPALLKAMPGNHQIEFRLVGYKPLSQTLSLTPSARVSSLRMTLEKQN